MGPRQERFEKIIVTIVVAIVAVAIYGIATADQTTKTMGALWVMESPILADPDRAVVSIGATATQGIADRSPAAETSQQRMLITNTSSTNNACVYWVAAGAACGSSVDCNLSGTNDGDLILPRSSKQVTVAGDLRTCIVAAVTSTVVHISRAPVSVTQ